MDGVRWMRPLAPVVPLLWALVVAATAMDSAPRRGPLARAPRPRGPAAPRPARRRGRASRASSSGSAAPTGSRGRCCGSSRSRSPPRSCVRSPAGPAPGTAPSAAMRQLARLSSLAEQRRNQLHVVVNVLTLWDLHVFFRLDDWRRRSTAAGRRTGSTGWPTWRRWRVSAATCTTGPDLVMPEVVDAGPRFSARAPRPSPAGRRRRRTTSRSRARASSSWSPARTCPGSPPCSGPSG